MNNSKIILLAVYIIEVGLILLAGFLYPQVKEWSYWAAGVCGLHAALAFIVASCKMADAGRIIASCWLGVSNLLCIVLLLPYFLKDQSGWVLATAVLGGFTLLVTLVLTLVLKPNVATERYKGVGPKY